MKIEEIKELILLFNESGLAEMEVKRGDDSVRFHRGSSAHEVLIPGAAAAVGAASTPPASVAAAAPGSTISAGAQPAAVDETHELVKSPIVGTYYDAPSPGSPVFVKVGDRVDRGQVLCIIESMKLMNEIESEIAGVIVAKLVENGRPVEYGEALFAIQPH